MIPHILAEGSEVEAVEAKFERTAIEELESARNEIAELQSKHESLLSEFNATCDDLTAANNELTELKVAHVMPEGAQVPVVDPRDVKELLTLLDTMLENIPEDMIEEFANSDDFVLYKAVLDGYGV